MRTCVCSLRLGSMLAKSHWQVLRGRLAFAGFGHFSSRCSDCFQHHWIPGSMEELDIWSLAILKERVKEWGWMPGKHMVRISQAHHCLKRSKISLSACQPGLKSNCERPKAKLAMSFFWLPKNCQQHATADCRYPFCTLRHNHNASLSESLRKSKGGNSENMWKHLKTSENSNMKPLLQWQRLHVPSREPARKVCLDAFNLRRHLGDWNTMCIYHAASWKYDESCSIML